MECIYYKAVFLPCCITIWDSLVWLWSAKVPVPLMFELDTQRTMAKVKIGFQTNVQFISVPLGYIASETKVMTPLNANVICIYMRKKLIPDSSKVKNYDNIRVSIFQSQ